MNISIIIGVSKYLTPGNDLPGCKEDAESIHEVILKTEKFDSVLYINNNESSAKTKELLTNFITENKSKVVDEIFFYFSGHGEFISDEFYYILSDYDSKRRKQTSLQNSEVDDLIRTLNPNITVKVIDACQSGTTYIKEGNVLNKYFNESKKSFKKCYFLNSSLNNQSSFQDDSLSFFTASFISAIKEHKTSEIRYKDIIDYISDEFENNQDQTPFFVIQADYTEKFCTLTKQLQEFLTSFQKGKGKGKPDSVKATSLFDLVSQDAKDYVDKDGALKTLGLVRKEFESFSLAGDLHRLFAVETKFLEDYQTVPKKSVVGKWIKDNDNTYFANPTYEKIKDEPVGILGQSVLQTSSLFGTPSYRYELNGFDLKIEVPFKTVSIDINSKYPNLLSYNCKVVFLLSKKAIRFFYFITNYIEESWDNKKLNTTDIEWVTQESKITDSASIVESIKKIKEKIESKMNKDIEDKFRLNTATGPTAPEKKSE